MTVAPDEISAHMERRVGRVATVFHALVSDDLHVDVHHATKTNSSTSSDMDMMSSSADGAFVHKDALPTDSAMAGRARSLAAAAARPRSGYACALAVALSACATFGEPRCASHEQAAVQDSLYFGTARAAGVVTAEEWSGFLEATVTPRFPRGLTVSQASGQWRGADGAIVRESTYVLHLLHASDAQSEAAIAAIVSAYKTQFRQEAVLRVRAKACMSF